MSGVFLNICFENDELCNEFDTLLEYISMAMQDDGKGESEELIEALGNIENESMREQTKNIIKNEWFWSFDSEYGQGSDEETDMPMIEIEFYLNKNSDNYKTLESWLKACGASVVKAEETEGYEE